MLQYVAMLWLTLMPDMEDLVYFVNGLSVDSISDLREISVFGRLSESENLLAVGGQPRENAVKDVIIAFVLCLMDQSAKQQRMFLALPT